METKPKEVEDGEQEVMKRPAAKKPKSSKTPEKTDADGSKEATQAKAKAAKEAKEAKEAKDDDSNGGKLYHPTFYKNSNRWGIKKGKKELVSVFWLHCKIINLFLGLPCFLV